MTESKLRVFVSSTIEDFRDLRSALKFWLEEMGLEVRMSEHNDFMRDPSHDTIESCLTAIDPCHYYILLIGGRRGYEVGQNTGLTITRMEFQRAMDLARRSGLVPLVFARDEVLVALKERKEIQKAFPEVENFDAVPSKYIDDPAFTTKFIDEIRTSALPGMSSGESGFLWYYHFKGFNDLVDTLRVTLPLRRNLRRQALLSNLKWELEDNIAKLSSKHENLPFPATWWLSSVRQQISIESREILEQILLDRNQAENLTSLQMFGLSAADRLSTVALLQAIQSGDFLNYIQAQRRLNPSPELMGMYRLGDEMERLRRMVQGLREDPLKAEMNGLAGNMMGKTGTYMLTTFAVTTLFAAHDAVQNILRLTIALYLWATDQKDGFQLPILNSPSPLRGQEEGIRSEQITHDELDRWLRNAFIRDQFTGLRTANAPEIQEAVLAFPEFERMLEPVNAELGQEIRALMDRFQELRKSEGEQAALEWLKNSISQRLSQESSE